MAKTGLNPDRSADVMQFMKPVDSPVNAEGKGSAGKKRTARRAPTVKQIRAAKLMSENIISDKPKTTGEIMKEAGYSDTIAVAPSKITQSDSFQDLLAEYMPDDDLATVHKRLLQTRKIEHMVFPLGPEGEDDEYLSGARPNQPNDVEEYVERTSLTDQEIKDMLAEVNCVVKRIVHGQTARHVYYWAHDANAQTKALELIYKLKGLLGKDDKGAGGINIFNLGQSTQQFVKKTGGDQ
jgi:hypothetical protein